MSREFSAEARNWLINYHGSIDSTALLLAFDAGVHSRDAEVERLAALIPSVERVTDAWTRVGIAPGYHKAAQAQLIKEWPTLARAVENLVANAALVGRTRATR